jgi:hypothetical protein
VAVRTLLKIAGLYTDPNSIGSVPEGALVEAENVIIDSDDVLESRRGFKVYGVEFSGGTAKQMLDYKDTILRHHSDLLSYDLVASPGTFTIYKEQMWVYANSLTNSGTTATYVSFKPHKLVTGDSVVISGADKDEYNGTFTVTVSNSTTFTYTMTGTPSGSATIPGPVLEAKTYHINQIDSSNKIRGVEAVNSNFYFTSDTGMKKLDRVSGYVSEIGAPKALDTDLELVDAATSPIMPQNSQVAYRVVWGYKDSNQNLILGAPSTSSTIGLSASSLAIPDFNALLDKLDDAAAINTGTLTDTDYNTLAIGTTASAVELNAALKELCFKLEADIGHSNPDPAVYGSTGVITNIPTGTAGSSVIITANNTLSVGDSVTLANTTSFPSIDGTYDITARTATNFTIKIDQAITVAATGVDVGSWTSGIAQYYPAPEVDNEEAFIEQQAFFDEVVDALIAEPNAHISAQGTLTIPTGLAGAISVTTNDTHLMANGASVEITGSTTTPSIDGTYTISNVTATTFDITVAADITVSGTADYIGQAQLAANFTNAIQGKNVTLTFTVPEGITTNYFYQIYRTQASSGLNINPGDDMGLVFESNPTAQQILDGIIEVTDETPDGFRGADLYTNPRQEGILQANEQPPFAKDVAIYKNIAFYANTKTRHKRLLSLTGVSGLVGTSLWVGNTRYDFVSGTPANGNEIEVQTSGTPAQNVDTTARNLVRTINRYADNTAIYAYYISGVDDIPGKLLLEARSISSSAFYVMSNSVTVGSTNFSPSVAPENNPITSISSATSAVITTTTAHGLQVGDQVYLVDTDTDELCDGLRTITARSSNTFTVAVNTTTSGSTARGFFKKAALAVVSDNEVTKNRIYYSKQNIYEAVPTLNFFNVGSGDKDILRIVALRDSLFVLKADGVYRISGETTSSLIVDAFDLSAQVRGPDTVAIGNNQIYAFSNQGVCTISDNGVLVISRPVEDQLLKLAPNANIPSTAFAVFYQTDRKYILWLPEDSNDTVSQRAWVYNNVTQAWTNWIQSKTCAIVNSNDDKLYLGASDINAIEQERKSFTRSDYADREYALSIVSYDATNSIATLSSVANVAIGDILVQTVSHTMELDYGSYDYEVEAKVVAVNAARSTVTVETVYDLITGPITLYKAYQCKITWAPEDAGNEGEIKQFREATARFKKSRITTPVLAFSSDLQSGFEEIQLLGPGLGNWGYFPWGGVPWGGDSRQRGFRTYIPLGKQRCSLLNCQFKHKVAREEWQLEGISLVVEVSSPRINR